jgi:3-oxoadipate enol-lactonase
MAAIADPVVERWFTPVYAAEHPGVIAQYRAMLLAAPVEGYASCCEAIAGMDLRDRLPHVAAPTLAVAAAQDLAIPAVHLATIAAAVPAARLEIVESAAHIATVEQPAVILRLLIDHFEGG